jgi:hypothetical protein
VPLDDRDVLTAALGQTARQNLARRARSDDDYVEFSIHPFALRISCAIGAAPCRFTNLSDRMSRRIQVTLAIFPGG